MFGNFNARGPKYYPIFMKVVVKFYFYEPHNLEGWEI